MDDTEIVRKIEEFGEFLSIGTVISDMVRWIGWVFLKGLAFIVDGLESVTDDVLLIKQFFQNPEIVAFVDTIRPFLYILLAFSLLYAGYLLILQKKFDREGMAINLFIALAIIVALSQGMGKANEFTDAAVHAVNATELYDEGEGSLSDNIISKQFTDVLEFDKKGWETTEVDPPNTLPLSMIRHISVTEKLDEDRKELELSSEGKDIVSHKLTWSVSEKELVELEDSTLMPWANESYYRYSINWLTLITTLSVMAFTLFSIAYKLARLSFELTFNYVLALIVAPADIHDGQKTKKIMQSILNTFLVIILIFLSMKIYMIGTAYVAAELDGLAYLIALIAFSVAVIDGPNIVERLFGIDAGLKNGWGVLAGAYAGGKLLSGASGAVMNTMNRSDGSGGLGNRKEGEENGINQQMRGSGADEKVLSPNDKEGAIGAPTGLAMGGAAAGSALANGVAGKKRIADLAEENNGMEKNGQAPSPNEDVEVSKEGAAENGSIPAKGKSGGALSPNSERGTQEPLQGAESSGGHVASPNDLERINSTVSGVSVSRSDSIPSAPSPNDAERANNGSISSTTAGTEQNEQALQRTVGGTNNGFESINEQTEGNTSFQSGSADVSSSPNDAERANSGSISSTTAGIEQNEQAVQRTVGRTHYGIESISEQTEGNTSFQSGSAGASASPSPNGEAVAAPASPTGGHSRTETVNGNSERLQNHTTINRSGGRQVVDENIVVNETQGNSVRGMTNVNVNRDGGAHATGAFNPDIPALEGSAASSSGTSRSVSQNSTSRENVTNETIVNRNLQQQTQQTDTPRVNEIRRPRTHNLNQDSSSTLDRIKNYRKEK